MCIGEHQIINFSVIASIIHSEKCVSWTDGGRWPDRSLALSLTCPQASQPNSIKIDYYGNILCKQQPVDPLHILD